MKSPQTIYLLKKFALAFLGLTLGLFVAGIFHKAALTAQIPNLVEVRASATTVKIYEMSADGSENFDVGSGFILSNNGTKHFVLTSAHNLDKNIDGLVNDDDKVKDRFAIQMEADDSQYEITSYYRLSTPNLGRVDLALITFDSPNKIYKNVGIFASLNDRFQLIEDLIVPTSKLYASGYPQSSTDFRIDECEMPNLIPVSKGDHQDGTMHSGGYGISCWAKTTDGLDKGMSGGPIFNQDGKIVGIFGRSTPYDERERLGILVDTIWEAVNDDAKQAVYGTAQAIPDEAAPRTFYCGTFQGNSTMMMRTPTQEIRVIIWVGADRCNIVSNNFQYAKNEGLNVFTTGVYNGNNILCATDRLGAECKKLLLSLPSSYSSEDALKKLMDTMTGRRRAVLLL